MQTKANVTGVTSLIEELTKNFNALQNNEISNAKAKEAARTASAIISATRVMLEYQKQIGEKPNVAFLSK